MSINMENTANITCGSMRDCGVKMVIWKKTLFLQSSITYELCDTGGHLITQPKLPHLLNEDSNNT